MGFNNNFKDEDFDDIKPRSQKRKRRKNTEEIIICSPKDANRERFLKKRKMNKKCNLCEDI